MRPRTTCILMPRKETRLATAKTYLAVSTSLATSPRHQFLQVAIVEGGRRCDDFAGFVCLATVVPVDARGNRAARGEYARMSMVIRDRGRTGYPT